VRSLSKSEWLIIPIWFDKSDNTCKLRERTPGEVRTEGDARVTWTIAGDCPGGHTVGISRRLKRGGRDHDLFAGSAPIEANAVDGARMEATLNEPKLIERGLYKYQVLIDGRPAQYNSLADEGNFFACPDWPC
jgi:cysteine synthase